MDFNPNNMDEKPLFLMCYIGFSIFLKTLNHLEIGNYLRRSEIKLYLKLKMNL